MKTLPQNLFTLLWLLCGAAALAAEPLLEKQDLFLAGQGGYALYHIPGIAVTAKGTVLAWCEARQVASDWDNIEIVLRRSTDDGKTWSEPQKFPTVPGPKTKNPVSLRLKFVKPQDVTYNNPVLIPARDGTVHALFCLEYMRCFHMSSQDDGLTWSAPEEITSTFEKFRAKYDWKVLATGPDHGIQLRNGRLLVPVWLSTAEGNNAHHPSITTTIFSDDAGKTWQMGDIAVPSTEEWVDPNETTAVELADGRVMLNVRTESKENRRLVTTSPDGATGWSKPAFDEGLPEPICMASLLRLSQAPGDKNRLLFSNPDNLARADGKEVPGKYRDRKNLTIKLSYDEGATWPVHRALEPGWSAYSDLAVSPRGTIFCFYGRGEKSGFAGDRLTLARFNLEWLTEGKDALAQVREAGAAHLEIAAAPKGATEPPRVPPAAKQDFIVFKEEGRYGGWPANHGLWQWGNELVAGFTAAWFKSTKVDHAVDRTRPFEEWQARSLDGGLTWAVEKPELLLHPPETGKLQALTEPLDFTAPDFALLFQFLNMNVGPSWFAVSQDRARHWEGPYAFIVPGVERIAARTDLVVLGPRDCLMLGSAAKADGKEGRTFCARTRDGGLTWKLVAWIGEEPAGFAIMPSTVRLKSGALITTIRRSDPGVSGWIETWRSDDLGEHWERLGEAATHLGGNPPALVQLTDGRLALTYGHRHPPSGIAARISTDEGRTWGPEIALREGGYSGDLGYPRSVVRPDGQVLTVYYWNGPRDEDRGIEGTVWAAPVM